EATVTVEYRDDALAIEVEDNGRGADDVTEGNGIAGMRERAASLGGELVALPRPGGGFRVHALLPLLKGSR
ncbi:MAG: ATP-binding protein, partial [Actinomycetota bacterium]